MTTPQHNPLLGWLSVATERLPEAVVQIVSQEVTDHFLEAVDDYLAQGLPSQEATTRALADLGLPEAVNLRLKDVHLGKPHYKAAAVASLLILTLLIVMPMLIFNLSADDSRSYQIGNLIMGVLMAGLTTYVLNTLRHLFVWRFGLFNLDKRVKLVMASYLLWLTADTLSLLYYSAPLYIGSLRPLQAAVSNLDKGFIIAAWIGQIGLGFTGATIAYLLWQSPDNLHGMGKLLAVCLMVMTVPIGLAGIAVNAGAESILYMLSLFASLGHITLWPTLTLLFTRATFRLRDKQPPQLA